MAVRMVRLLAGLLLSLLLLVSAVAAFQTHTPVLGIQQKERNIAGTTSTTTTTTTTTTTQLAAFRIRSKKRGKVVLDPETGFYRPEKPVKSPRGSGDSHAGRWKTVKIAVYGAFDDIRSLKGKLQRVAAAGQEEKDTAADLVVGGYEEHMIKQQYEKIPKQSPIQDSLPISAFDSVKGAVYETVDAASKITNTPAATTVKPPTMQTFKPVVESTRKASKDVQQSLLDRGSDNPVKRAAAQRKIRAWEQKYLNQPPPGKKEAVALKDSIYQIGDAVESVMEGVLEFPNTALAAANRLMLWGNAAARFVASVPAKMQQAVETVQAIPTAVEQTAAQVKQSVQKGITATAQLVDDIKAIPVTVQQTVQQTKESLHATVDSVNELTTVSKVMLGLEKPVPKPPKKRPPKLTTSEIGWKVAGTVASGAGKAAWWVGKGAASMAFRGAKLAFAKGAEALPEMSEQAKSATKSTTTTVPHVTKPEMTTSAAVAVSDTKQKDAPASKTPGSPPSKLATPPLDEPELFVETKEVPNITDLDRQVNEALRQAADALQYSNKRD